MALFAVVRAGWALWAKRPLALSVRGLTLFFAVPVFLMAATSLWHAVIRSSPAEETHFLRAAAAVGALFVVGVFKIGRGIYVAGVEPNAFMDALKNVLERRGLRFEVAEDRLRVEDAPDVCLQFYPDQALALVNTEGEPRRRFLRRLVKEVLGDLKGEKTGETGGLILLSILAAGLLLLSGWWLYGRLSTSPDFWVGHGRVFVETGRYEKALIALDRAVLKDPNHARAWAWRGTALFLSGKEEEAESSLERARSIAPRDPLAALHLARFLATASQPFQDPPRALALARDAQDKLPGHPLAADTLAAAHAAAGNFKQAAKAQQRAVGLLEDRHAARGLIDEARVRLRSYRNQRR